MGIEAATLNQWYPIHVLSDLPAEPYRDRLLGVEIVVSRDGVAEAATGRPLKTLQQYRYLWASFGDAPPPLFLLPEALEADRLAASIRE